MIHLEMDIIDNTLWVTIPESFDGSEPIESFLAGMVHGTLLSLKQDNLNVSVNVAFKKKNKEVS